MQVRGKGATGEDASVGIGLFRGRKRKRSQSVGTREDRANG